MKQRRHGLARRLTAFVGAVALLIGLQPAVPAAAATATIQVATLNILYKLNRAEFVADLELITSKADLVGLNEVGQRKEFLQDWAAANGWWLYMPGPTQAANEALLAKKSMFDVVGKDSEFVCDTDGPGDAPPARYNNWVRYRHKASGRDIIHINLHANADIETNGRPDDEPRTECAQKQFQDVKSLAIRKQDLGEVVVSGDLNVDFSADKAYGHVKFPWKVFEANDLPNLRSVYNLKGEKGGGTHGNRHIDYIYFWKRVEARQHLWLNDYHLVGETNSDHNGVVASFDIEL
ncbi:endonuclease/exonuclease/phosphatase family protein [Micromonospora sp. DT233]|uniref:endonuclease/exonuclease/phosphatase family protein n=1 Tax=Micromonospora sp. DT233 TaxID=3393432 RepID=UPI003CEDCC6D